MSEIKLDNGLKIITNYHDSEFVTMAFYINKGACDEADNQIGIAHLVEHLVFKGTVSRDKAKIWQDIQKYGGKLNAYTAETHTVFFVHCLKKYMDEAFDVLAEIVFLNTIPEGEFELEKSVVIEELKMYENEIESQILTLRNKVLYNGIVNRYNVGGTPETVSKITRKQVVDFIAKNYIPNNITFVVTGDIEEKHFVDKCEEYLKDFQFIKKSPNYRKKNIELTFKDAKETKDGTQSAMCIIFPMYLKNQKEVIMEMIAELILCGGFNSRLMKIREDYGYVYHIDMSSDYDYVGEKGFACIFTQLNSQNIPKVKELILEYLTAFYEKGFTDSEFEQAFNTMQFDFRKQFETVNSINSITIINNDCGMPYNEDGLLKILNTITKEDLNDFIKEKYKDLELNFIEVEQTR